MYIRHSHLVLDACCILNFCASGNFLGILQAIPAQVVVSEVVKDQEIKTIQSLEDEENEGILQFEKAIESGLLLVVDFASEAEEETFVNTAFVLRDDGESATFALAFHRRWGIATDDKKAIAFFQKEAPQLQIISTLAIVKHWSEQENIDAAQLKITLSAIKIKGRYIPPRNHPLLTWWENAME
jgi:predicted nucleic acid-binding protein